MRLIHNITLYIYIYGLVTNKNKRKTFNDDNGGRVPHTYLLYRVYWILLFNTNGKMNE